MVVIRAQPFSGGQVTSFLPPRGCSIWVMLQKGTVKAGVLSLRGGRPYSSQCEPQFPMASMVAPGVNESWNVP
jgi:hypothetical protein